MALKDFLAKSQEAAPKKFEPNNDDSVRIKYIYMNAQSNQGSIKFIPVVGINGDYVSYLYDTGEFQVYTDSDNGRNWRWGKILQEKDYTTKLTQEQRDKVGKGHSLLSALQELNYGTEWVRYKNYSVFLGYVISHINSDNEVLIDSTNRTPAIIVCPSKNIAKSMTTILEQFANNPKGEEYFDMLFNRNLENRQMYLELIMKRGSGFGYDVNIGYKMFDLMTQSLLLDDELSNNGVNIPKEAMDLLTNPSAVFVGSKDPEGKDFIEEFIDQVITQAQAEVNKSVAENRAKEVVPEVPSFVEPKVDFES